MLRASCFLYEDVWSRGQFRVKIYLFFCLPSHVLWCRTVPGASVRNSAHGKGHEEGGFGKCKDRIEPQETPCSQASTPKTRVYLLYCFMLSPTPLTLWGAVPHHFSWRRSKLAAPVNKNSWAWQGCLRSNLSAGRLACVTGLSTLLPLCTWLFTTSQP